MILDAEHNALKLEQAPEDYFVSADLSVPGWWPWVELTQHTAWIGNWNDGQLLDQGNIPTSTTSRLMLPTNRSDLDGLTRYLSQRTIGGSPRLTRILEVQPHTLSLCSSNPVALQVYGTNVWRSTRVFLGDVAANEGQIRVLPDMEGISVTLDPKLLRGMHHAGKRHTKVRHPDLGGAR